MNSIKLVTVAIFAIVASLSSNAAGKFTLTSKAEKAGDAIGADYYANSFGCTAKNMSPDLEWSNPPAGTKSFAITYYDKDAPTGSGFWHYQLLNVPATVTKIDANALSQGKLPAGSVAHMNDSGKPDFIGPCPPPGRKHTYTWTVIALKTDKLEVPKEATPAFVGFNLWMNTIDKASFEVTAGPRK